MTTPTSLIVEITAEEDCPVDFLGDSADIVYFISFAHSDRYGAAHPLSKAAGFLKRRLRIDLAPLLIFADARTESAAEEAALESMWQDPAPLAECARHVADAIESNEQVRDLTDGFPELPDRLRELAAMADWAARKSAKIRLTYIL